MDYRESRFTTGDGLTLHCRSWLPLGEPKAVLVLVHGLSEHSGRYRTLGEHLTRHGYALSALDLRGHGMSGGERIFVRSLDVHLSDVAAFLDRLRAEQPGRPLVLFGHSMGGLIVASLAVLRELDVCGLVLSAPALRVSDEVAPGLRWLARAASLLAPRLRIVRIRSGKLSRDPSVVDGFNNDPLVYHGYMPNRTAGEILRGARWIQHRLESVRLPFLAMHGTGDAVTDPAGSRQLYLRSQSTDKTLKLYDGLWHDLLREPEKAQVMADLVDWLDARRGC
ncbi:MAG: lysophospholipase [Pirellulales bacterium]|nr:lysophospholipase [Pirellulales bacterium]